ncbi:hypothetical protein [Streptomyces sp. NPDC060198]|uniref:hypothetical protein n=1 Tax=Streptomyces sp. NPDC060198 TaxID=3347070 RepID=UPI003664D27B
MSVGQPQAWQTSVDPTERQLIHGRDVGGPEERPGQGPSDGAGRGTASDPAFDHDRLRHHDEPWIKAAGGAEALHTNLGTARSELEKAHEGLLTGESTEGFAVLGELAAVRESWVRRISTAQGECGSLAGKLRTVAREQRTTDEAVRESFGPLVDLPVQSTLPPLSLTRPPSSLYLLGGSDE